MVYMFKTFVSLLSGHASYIAIIRLHNSSRPHSLYWTCCSQTNNQQSTRKH